MVVRTMIAWRKSRLWRGLLGMSVLAGTVAQAQDADGIDALPRNPPAVISVDRAKGEIRIIGSLSRDSSRDFASVLAGPGGESVQTVRVNSPGGDARAGLEIARQIRDRNLSMIVDHICGSACAVYLLPAATHASFEPGATINLHHMPSPLMTEIGVAVLHRRAQMDGRDEAADHFRLGMDHLIEDQRSFYETLGIDPYRMERIMDVWVELHERILASRKPVDADTISFVPDKNFINECLGFNNTDWRAFTREDSIIYARRGMQPQAFLINGYLYFEGERLSNRDFGCEEPVGQQDRSSNDY